MPKPKLEVIDRSEEILGSVIRITVVCADEKLHAADNAIQSAFDECKRLDLSYSRFRSGNLLTEINTKVNEWQTVNGELFYLLKAAYEISEKTDWAFDLGVKEVLENWGYDANYSFKEKDKTNGDGGDKSKSFELGPDNLVKLFRTIELGGLGKGYALDLMVKKLAAFENFCVDAGGDIFAKGMPKDDTPWRIFFEHPKNINEAMGEVEVDGFFLASSNPLKRKWAKYHHLVDPKTNLPANKMLAVYIQADSGLMADAYSTALFVLGFDKAVNLLEQLPIEAMLVSSEGQIFRTKNFKGELYLAA